MENDRTIWKDTKRLLSEKTWRVVKRKQIDINSYHQGEFIEMITQRISLPEARKLKDNLNSKRTYEESKQFYFIMERMEDLCPVCNIELVSDIKAEGVLMRKCHKCGYTMVIK